MTLQVLITIHHRGNFNKIFDQAYTDFMINSASNFFKVNSKCLFSNEKQIILDDVKHMRLLVSTKKMGLQELLYMDKEQEGSEY